MDELAVRAAPPERATRLAVGLPTLAVTIFLSAAVPASEGTSGDAIFYGATVDKVKRDPTLQLARPAP